MPTLLPREKTNATSVIQASVQRPSPSDHRVGFSIWLTRLRVGSLALRPAFLLFGNSRQWITPPPLPHATVAYGQLHGRDFNPLDLLLLLRTARPTMTRKTRSTPPTFIFMIILRQSSRGKRSQVGWARFCHRKVEADVFPTAAPLPVRTAHAFCHRVGITSHLHGFIVLSGLASSFIRR